jgi:lysozyme family protein
MNPGAELQYELGRAVNTLRRRAASTGDTPEQQALTKIVARLNKLLAGLDQADALTTANALADGQETLELAVAAVRHGPFDGYLVALEEHADTLSKLSGSLHGFDALLATPAGDAVDTTPATPRARRRGATARGDMVGAALPAGLAAPATSTDFAALRDEYAAWYAACQPRPERQGELAYYLKRLKQGQATYQQVGASLNIPWVFIGITHGMECGFNFLTHLHNGDPLSARTVQVPKGRPASGNPPFTWSQSARDALIFKGYHQVDDWSVPHMLHLFERYNGMGYRRRGVPTPYLWSYSNLYAKGKFVADGHFDPEAVSKQCGAALMLKSVMN